MGSFPRGYARRFNWRGFLPPAMRMLVISCAAVFLLQELSAMIWGQRGWNFWLTWFGLVPAEVIHGFFWQLFTYLFLHGGLWHILLNLLVLWMFGADLERLWGARRFLTYYFICGVGAGVVNVIVKLLLDPTGKGSAGLPTIGASGAIYGVLIAAKCGLSRSR
jgi:rhomboid family protein